MICAALIAFITIVAFVFFLSMTGAINFSRRLIPVMTELIGQMVIYAPIVAYMLLFLPRLAKRSLAELGIRPPSWREVGIGLVGFPIMMLAVFGAGAIVVAITHNHDTEAAISIMKNIKTAPERLLFVAIALILAPMAEELAFRVFLFNAFARYAPMWVAVVVSGLLFGAVHGTTPSQLLSVGIPIACGGIVLAVVYAISRNYWSSVITHALFNSVSVTAFFAFHVKA